MEVRRKNFVVTKDLYVATLIKENGSGTQVATFHNFIAT